VGLLAKAAKKQKTFGNSYKRAIALSVRLRNAFANGRVEAATVTTTWKDKTVRDDKAHIEVLKGKKELGIPEPDLWAEMGYDQAQITRFSLAREASRDQALGLMVRQIATAGTASEPAE